MRTWSFPLLVFVLAALFGSCLRQEDFNRDMFADSGIDYDIAIPLTDTKLTMENLIDLKGGLFVPDDTSLLHIVYAMEPVKAHLIEEITLGQASPFVLSTAEIPYRCLKDTVIKVPFDDTIHFDLKGLDATVKTLYFTAAQMKMESRNSFLFPMELDMRLENVKTQDGQPVVYRYQTPASSQGDTVIGMRNIRVEMPEMQEPYIVMKGTATVNVRRVEGDSNFYSGSLYVSSNLSQMDFWRAEGYFDSLSYTIADEMSIEGLGLERMKNISFEEAQIIADLKVSGVSAPLRLSKTKVLIHNMGGNVTEVPLLPDDYEVDVPAFDADPLEKESRESMEVVDMLIDRPQKITYRIDGKLNPDKDASQMQAMQKGSFLSVGLTCDVPLHFSADHYALCDTMEVSLDDLDENTELRYFDVKSIVKNAFPLDVVFSLHFLDAGYNKLFSLFHDDLVAGGKIGPAPGLHVIEPTVVNFEDILDLGEMKLAKQMHYVAVEARISTTDQQKVKVYVDGEKEGFVNVKVGVRIKLKQKGLLDF